MNSSILFILILLPVAAMSGWYFAIRSVKKEKSSILNAPEQKKYFKGLNYLLQDQPDKAIDVFIDMVEIDSDTVETHLALGSLFRRRGEVDRAIRIHQNIIARPSLDNEQHESALYELATDYQKAGLYDRAEGLLLEIGESDRFQMLGMKKLQSIYQKEKEWEKAIVISKKLLAIGDQETEKLVRNFICEKVEIEISNQNIINAKKILLKNKKYLDGCVRASLLWGDIFYTDEKYQLAYNCLIEAIRIDIEYLPEVIGRLKECAVNCGNENEFEQLLMDKSNEYEGIVPALYLIDYVETREGTAAAGDFLYEQIKKYPSIKGLQKYLYYSSLLSKDDGAILAIIDTILDNKPIYKCRICGFETKKNHWMCPSCQSWESVKPLI